MVMSVFPLQDAGSSFQEGFTLAACLVETREGVSPRGSLVEVVLRASRACGSWANGEGSRG